MQRSAQVERLMAGARFAAKREAQLRQLMELRNKIAAARAYNSLLPSLAESLDIYRDLCAADEAIARAIRRLRKT